MNEIILSELGYFTEKECQAIKDKCEGKSYLKFQISWSNWTGNCTLIVGTHYEFENTYKVKEEFKNFFLHCALSALVEQKKES